MRKRPTNHQLILGVETGQESTVVLLIHQVKNRDETRHNKPLEEREGEGRQGEGEGQRERGGGEEGGGKREQVRDAGQTV